MTYFTLREQLSVGLSINRFRHSLGVSSTAEQLAKLFGVEPERARLAGLLHDCAREYKTKELVKVAQSAGINVLPIDRALPILLHAPLGAWLAKEKYGVHDEEIQVAITLHTTGGVHMSKLAKIIYLADMIEPNREYDGVEKLRDLAENDLDKAMKEALDQSIGYLIENGQLIHPDTILARNEILIKGL